MTAALSALARQLAHVEAIDLHYYRHTLGADLIELEKMAACPQDGAGHGEGDVLTHTQMVMNAARAEILANPQLPTDIKRAVYLAAFLHDVGKPETTYTTAAGRVLSPGHAAAAVPLARALLYRLGVPFSVREHTVMLILLHMAAHRLAARVQPNMTVQGVNIEARKYRKLSTEVDHRALYHLTRANWLGRNAANTGRVLDHLEEFRERSNHYGLWHNGFAGVLSDEELSEYVTDARERARVKHELLQLSLAGEVQTGAQARRYLEEHPELLRATRAQLFVTIGLPGSGKSTWLEAHLEHVHVVSSDRKREELFGDINWQGDNARVFSECFHDIEQALARGQQVVLDATNTRLNQRAGFLNMARRYHAHTTIIYFDMPLEVAIERNSRRARQVPPAAIVKYFQQMDVPRVCEVQELRLVSEPAQAPWV